MLKGTPYDFSQINPEVVKGFGAQKEIGSNSINDSEWTRESTNPMTHMSWIFNNSTLYFFYYDMQHLPDSAKGTRSAPIQFSIEGSEWIQLPIKEQDLVRILGKPKKISREPLFP